jgi:predicted RNA-binding protein with RPS1 domain
MEKALAEIKITLAHLNEQMTALGEKVNANVLIAEETKEKVCTILMRLQQPDVTPQAPTTAKRRGTKAAPAAPATPTAPAAPVAVPDTVVSLATAAGQPIAEQAITVPAADPVTTVAKKPRAPRKTAAAIVPADAGASSGLIVEIDKKKIDQYIYHLLDKGAEVSARIVPAAIFTKWEVNLTDLKQLTVAVKKTIYNEMKADKKLFENYIRKLIEAYKEEEKYGRPLPMRTITQVLTEAVQPAAPTDASVLPPVDVPTSGDIAALGNLTALPAGVSEADIEDAV